MAREVFIEHYDVKMKPTFEILQKNILFLSHFIWVDSKMNICKAYYNCFEEFNSKVLLLGVISCIHYFMDEIKVSYVGNTSL